MTLDEYLSKDGNTAARLAADAGTSAATITRLLYGDQNPSADLIRALVAASGGAITAEGLIFGKPRPKPERAA